MAGMSRSQESVVLRSRVVNRSPIHGDTTPRKTVTQPADTAESFKPAPCTKEEWELAWIEHGREYVCPNTCAICGEHPLVLPPVGVKRNTSAYGVDARTLLNLLRYK